MGLPDGSLLVGRRRHVSSVRCRRPDCNAGLACSRRPHQGRQETPPARTDNDRSLLTCRGAAIQTLSVTERLARVDDHDGEPATRLAKTGSITSALEQGPAVLARLVEKTCLLRARGRRRSRIVNPARGFVSLQVERTYRTQSSCTSHASQGARHLSVAGSGFPSRGTWFVSAFAVGTCRDSETCHASRI